MSYYPLTLEPDGETILVRSRDFPELVTFGNTRDDALCHARNALEEAIAARIACNEDIPPAMDNPGESECVELPVMVRLKCALYMLLRHRGLTRAELQRMMHLPHREQVDRLLRLDHNTNIETMIHAFKVLGAPLEIRIPVAA